MRRYARIIAAAAFAALLLSGCGEALPGGGQEEAPPDAQEALGGSAFVERTPADRLFSLNWDPEAGVNPVRTVSAANLQFWSLLYDSVFTVDDDWSVSSELVTGYTTDDYIWWVFTVDTSIRWSDGTQLSARDVAYSIQMAQRTDYYGGRLDCIYGCSAFDAVTFAITTKKAVSQLPALLNIPVIKNGQYYEDWPVGTGPYMLSEAHDALVPNPEYDRAEYLPLDVIYLRDYMDVSDRITAFEDASIDLVTNDPTGMYNLGYGSSNEKRYCETTNLHYVGFNTRSSYFLTAAARGAVARLIDRDYVVETLMRGCGVASPLPVHPRSPLYDAEYAASFGHDSAMAMALFEAAGVGDLDYDGALEMLITGIIVELNIKFIVNNDSSVKVAAARRLAEDLNALGITTTLYELSWDEYLYTLSTGDFDMYYGELRLAADWDLGSLFAVPDTTAKTVLWGSNYARTTDEAYTRLYDAYLAAPEDQRYAAFQEAARYVLDTGILLPVCFERREVLTHRGVVSGIRATQYDLFNHFPEWTVELG